MARVELGSQAWGWVTDTAGNALPSASVQLETLDGNPATHYTAVTGGSSSTADLLTNADGTLPGFVEGGTYNMTVDGVTRRVDAVPGSIEPRVAVVVSPLVHGGVGDSSQDEIDALEGAIADVQARVEASGGGAGAVDLGYGVWKISRTLTIPSNVVLVSRNAYGFSIPMGSAGQIQPFTGFTDDWLIDTPVDADAPGLSGIRVYINDAFTCNGIRIRGEGWFVDRVRVANCHGTALRLEGAHGGVLQHSVLSGHYARSGAFKSLSALTGGALHVDSASYDNLYFNNELDGGANSGSNAYALRSSTNLYFCAAYSAGGGIDRWIGNICENGDQGAYLTGGRNQVIGNRFEWNSGHGLQVAGVNAVDHTFSANTYNNNGLGQNDRFYDLFQQGGRCQHTGERFTRDTGPDAISTHKVAACVWDGSTGDFANQYANLSDDGHAISAPFVTANRANYDRPDVRAAFPRRSMFSSEPTTGTFTTGETFRLGGRAANQYLGRFVRGGGTLGTLTGVTMDTTSGSATVTVNDGTLVPVGSILSVAGVTWTGAPNPNFGRVLHKNGNTLTMDGTASGTVSGAAASYNAPTVQDWGALKLSGSATYDPPSLTTGSETSTQTVTVTGAALGNLVQMSFSLDLQGVALRGWVSASNTVSFRFRNDTGGTVDLGSGTVRALVTSA